MPSCEMITRWYMETSGLTNYYTHNLHENKSFSVGLLLLRNILYSYDVKVTGIRPIRKLLG